MPNDALQKANPPYIVKDCKQWTCPTKFLVCVFWNRLACFLFLFTAYLYTFSACPAEILLTQQSKTGRHPVLTGSVQVKSFMFMTGQFAFKCSQSVWSWSSDTEQGQGSNFFKA